MPSFCLISDIDPLLSHISMASAIVIDSYRLPSMMAHIVQPSLSRITSDKRRGCTAEQMGERKRIWRLVNSSSWSDEKESQIP